MMDREVNFLQILEKYVDKEEITRGAFFIVSGIREQM